MDTRRMKATFVDDWEYNERDREWWWYNYTITLKNSRFYLRRYYDAGGIDNWIQDEELGDFPDPNRATLFAADHWYLRRFPALVEGHTHAP